MNPNSINNRSHGRLGRSWKPLGRVLARLGGLLGRLWPILGSSWRILGRLGRVLAHLGRVWASLGALMLAFKWSLAVPERSEDVPRSCRAGIIDFLMVFGGLGGGEATARAWAGHADQVRSDPLKQVFQDKPNTTGTGTGTGLGTGTGTGTGPGTGTGTGTGAWARVLGV